jgi:hypothetical protein
MSDPYAGDPWAVDEPTPEPGSDAPAAEHPADEAQSEFSPATKENVTVTVTNRTASEGKIVTTIKYGAGFDAPWTVIHSDTPEEALATLNSPTTRALIEQTAKVAKYSKGLDSGTAPAGQRSGNGGGGQHQQQSTPPGVEAKNCAHGEMTYRTGTSQKGPWKAYFCPAPNKEDQCKPIWMK